MTLHATRSGNKITIGGNTGVSVDLTLGTGVGAPRLVVDNGYVPVRITEDVQHVRYFWGQLGRLLEEAEAEATAAVQEQAEPSS